jgi:hypothetical protein
MSDPQDDLATVMALSRAFDQLPPVPAHLTAAAESSFEFIDLDSVLAELITDSTDAELAGVRGHGGDRRSFRFGALDSIIRVHLTGSSVMLMLEPPLSVACRIVTRIGAVSARTDDLGELIADAPELPVRIEIDLPSGAVRTPWIIG